MRRVAVALAPALLCVGASLAHPAAAVADPATCRQYDSHGICVVGAETAQDGRDTTAPPAETTSDSESPAASCTVTHSGAAIPCQDGAAWWVQAMQCYAEAMVEQPSKDSPVWGGRTTGGIYNCRFYTGGGAFPGTSGFTFWSATPPALPTAVDPAELAQQALSTLTVPPPTPGRYPAGLLQNGQPYTVVNSHTWFWTDPGSFQALTARADAGGVWAEVRVTPTGLSFTPGDGAAPVSCAGPGVAWRVGDGVWAPSPAGCDYQYAHSSINQPDGQVTATYGIQWSVAWTSSTGATGTLPNLTTSSNATFAVAEVQSVVVR